MLDVDPQSCLHKYAEAAARVFPGAPAVLFKGETVSYEELMRRANRMARALRRRGIGEGSIVALDLRRSPSLIVAQLATLKAGAAYLSLDHSHPLERRRAVVAEAKPALMVTDRELVEELGAYDRISILEQAAPETAASDDETISEGRPDALAYVTYTSGSTGRPKGVLSHHRGAANYIAHMIAARGLAPAERVLQFSSLSFDASVRDTLGTLAFGGTIVLLDDEEARNPLALLSAIREQGATLILAIVPTTMRLLVRAALGDGGLAPGRLRVIMVGGEPLLHADVERARMAFGPETQIVNQYGATECSMVTTDYLVPAELPPGPTSLPVGRPIANTNIYILDRHLAPVPPGAEGDVYIGGVGVGPGYLNLPDQTAERFLHDPRGATPQDRMYRTGDLARRLPDGTLCLVGRVDLQVKIKGNRVELEEIESVLREHPVVREAAVLQVAGPERSSLAAYVTLDGRAEVGALRAFLAARLPFFMIPASFVVLNELPHTSTGKIDRKLLPRAACSPQSRSGMPPRTMTEARLVSLWSSVLGGPQVGATDDFFELGGDSLMAAELLARMEDEFGRVIPASMLFEHGTVEELARAIDSGEGPDHAGVVSLQPHGARAPVFLIPGYLYLRELALGFAPDRPVYGLQVDAPFTTTIEEEALAHFRNLIAFRPVGPYLLVGHSAGGYLALETARLLERDGRRVEYLGLIDTFPPGRRRQPDPMKRLQIYLETLSAKSPGEIMAIAAGALRRRALAALRHLPGQRRLVLLLGRTGAKQTAGMLAVRTYDPEPYPGPVTVFSVQERPWYIRWDPMERWNRTVTGQLTIRPTPGDHLSAVRPPLAPLLARAMEVAITGISPLRS